MNVLSIVGENVQ